MASSKDVNESDSMPTNGKLRPFQLLSIDTRMIYERLQKAAIGETVTYNELSALIGRNVRTVAMHCLRRAINKALGTDNVVFGCVATVGFQRLEDAQISKLGNGIIERSRRMARKGVKKLSCVRDFAALSNEDKVLHNASMSILSAVCHFTHGNKVKAVERKVVETQAMLPVQKTLDVFRDGK